MSHKLLKIIPALIGALAVFASLDDEPAPPIFVEPVICLGLFEYQGKHADDNFTFVAPLIDEEDQWPSTPAGGLDDQYCGLAFPGEDPAVKFTRRASELREQHQAKYGALPTIPKATDPEPAESKASILRRLTRIWLHELLAGYPAPMTADEIATVANNFVWDLEQMGLVEDDRSEPTTNPAPLKGAKS